MRLGGFLALLFSFGLATGLWAQDGGATWIQIEARPSLTAAEGRAEAYEESLSDVAGFRLSSGWYAIALGPYASEDARATLTDLRRRGLVPPDSYLSDGTGYSVQFWPRGASFSNLRPAPVTAAPEPQTEPQTGQQAAAQPQRSAESLADARARERELTREDRQNIQRALAYEGYYAGAIDGAFGPGTRRAIAEWQLSISRVDTGYLTGNQLDTLLGGYDREVGSLGLAPVQRGGIEIALPLGIVAYEGSEAPFATYAATGDGPEKVLLISQPGGRAALGALYDIMQTLEIIPLDGPRSLGRDRFTIEGSDGTVAVTAIARHDRDEIKGYVLIWPEGDARRRALVLQAMDDSFRAIRGETLDPDSDFVARASGPNFLSGLEIRRPERARSGFFVSGDGAVLTSSAAVGGCSRLTIGEETSAEIAAVDSATGLVLLRPSEPLRPIGVAGFAAADAAPAEIAVSGFSYEGALGAPSLTFGRTAAQTGLDGDAGLTRLAVAVEPGDAGGPVLDGDGSVVGLMLPRDDSRRQLPQGTEFAVAKGAITGFLDANGIRPASGGGAPLDAYDLGNRAADMTVLVQCWN